MIREAEPIDKDKLSELYRMLVPNSKKRWEPSNKL
jgi:hypothetical protein